MIKNIKVVNYLGESITITLSDGSPKHGLIITGIDGLGPPKANINTMQLATMDGSLYNSARTDQRNIVICMIFEYSPTIEDTRLLTYKYFPIKKPVELYIETEKRTVKTVGYVESNEPDIFSSMESNQISIICTDPYFYLAGDDEITKNVLYGVNPLFEFEFSNESLNESLLEFGSIDENKEHLIYYDGDVETGMTITIHAIGDVGDITIYNVKTREYMKIDESKIQFGIKAGDDIIITTVKGDKKVQLLRDGVYSNILNALDMDSDWLQLRKGYNTFAFTSESGFENIILTIENRIVYEGV